MASCTGESMASNRKNKLICYWDYELELKWECVKKINANDKITGMASILSHYFVSKISLYPSTEKYLCHTLCH